MPSPTPIDLSLNLMPHVIDEELFAGAGEHAVRAALQVPSSGLNDQNGTVRQRAVLAGWLSSTRLEVDPDAMILCIGAQQAIHFTFVDLGRISPTIASESSTFSGAVKVAASLGLGWEVIAHDDDGMVPDDLERVLRQTGCRAVFTTPVCQNPLGFEVSDARRRMIVEICERHGAFIIEDDIYGIYAAKGRMTYRELAPERVYYLNSFSKCLSPLLRLGVLVPPQDRLEPILKALRAQISGVSPIIIELGCKLIDQGAADEAASRLRAEAQARTELAKDVLGLASLPMPGGAPHIWLAMAEAEAERFARRALEIGVRVATGAAFSTGTRRLNGVRLSILAPQDRNEVLQALKLLQRCLPS